MRRASNQILFPGEKCSYWRAFSIENREKLPISRLETRSAFIQRGKVGSISSQTPNTVRVPTKSYTYFPFISIFRFSIFVFLPSTSSLRRFINRNCMPNTSWSESIKCLQRCIVSPTRFHVERIMIYSRSN